MGLGQSHCISILGVYTTFTVTRLVLLWGWFIGALREWLQRTLHGLTIMIEAVYGLQYHMLSNRP